MLPKVLALKALANGEPFVGAAFGITVPTTKNALSVLPVGPSDEQGEYRIERNELDRRIREATSLGLMDYGGLLHELHVRVLNRDDIEGCRVGYARWKKAGVFPDDYSAWLEERELALAAVAGAELRAVVGAQGGTFRVSASVQFA
jgi:hypothetical protein